MAAHPKNKITRAEQGKRRAGNTPKLMRDTKVTKVPLHKKTLVSRIMSAIGLTKTAPVAAEPAKHHTEPKAVAAQAPVQAKAAPKKQAAVKTVRKTQHKG